MAPTSGYNPTGLRMTPWPDLCLAFPGMGLRFAPDFTRSFLDRLAPLWAEMGPTATVTYPGQAATVVQHRGWHYTVDPQNVIVEFKHDVRVESEPGQLPRLSAPDFEKYTLLLDGALERVQKVLKLLLDDANAPRRLERIGVFVATTLPHRGLPPGIEAFLNRLGDVPVPGKQASKINAQIIVDLEDDDVHVDRCHHAIAFDRSGGNESGVVLRLDWQRYYREQKAWRWGRDLKREIGECLAASAAYISDFGDSAI